MAILHNSIRVLGVVVTDGSKPLYNNQPVIGVRSASDPDAKFEQNHIVRKVEVIESGAVMWNDQRVIGVYVVPDGVTMWGNQPVIPVVGLPEPDPE